MLQCAAFCFSVCLILLFMSSEDVCDCTSSGTDVQNMFPSGDNKVYP